MSTAESSKPRRPGPRASRAGRADQPHGTRGDVFLAAAHAFSTHGYDGVSVDEIAKEANVNKAMIYYHFSDKLTLYREVVRDMLRDAGGQVTAIAEETGPADERLARFIETFVNLKDARPWMPTLMLREMAEGAPHLDLETLGLMRGVFASFSRIVADGQQQGLFGSVHPVLGYLSVLGPLLLNAARERSAAEPGRKDLPMFVEVSREDLVRHLQQIALRMLAKD